MWTFLVMFLSLVVVVGVFFRRMFLYFKNKGEAGEKAVEAESPLEEESENIDEKKLSKKEKLEVKTLFEQGVKFLEQGKDDEAVKSFVQALAIDALHIETQGKLAVLYLKKQMFGAAAALFKQLGDLTEDPVHYSHLGLALYQQNDFAGAAEAYKKALIMDDSRPQRFVSLSQVYRSMGRLNHAVVALEKAMQIEKENADFVLLMAEMLAEMGAFAKAKDILDKQLELNPQMPAAKEMLKEVVRAERLTEKEKATKNI